MFFESMFGLEGKVAVVTGARRGIGRVLALGLAEAGADVAVTDIVFPDVEKVAEEIRGLGKRALACHHDVTKPQSCHEVMDTVVRELGSLDILINNAGVVIPEPSTEMSEATWDHVVDVNLKGAFFCAQAAARHMIKQGGGRIINIASILGFVGLGGRASYSASKGGVVALTRELAVEWAPHNINVNAIAPGTVKTEMSKPLHENKEYLARLLDRLVIKRVADTRDILGAAIFFASDASAVVTGQTLLVDQGWSIK